jgi:hypothetical protein
LLLYPDCLTSLLGIGFTVVELEWKWCLVHIGDL